GAPAIRPILRRVEQRVAPARAKPGQQNRRARRGADYRTGQSPGREKSRADAPLRSGDGTQGAGRLRQSMGIGSGQLPAGLLDWGDQKAGTVGGGRIGEAQRRNFRRSGEWRVGNGEWGLRNYELFNHKLEI